MRAMKGWCGVHGSSDIWTKVPAEAPSMGVMIAATPSLTCVPHQLKARAVQVFADTKHLIQSAIDGYNVCIFAYGQTGSGKTFTIYGNENEPGLTPRGITELFKVLAD